MTSTDQSTLLAHLERADHAELRGEPFELPASGREPSRAYRYQLTAMERVEDGEREGPYASGIVYFPTGAGKTRVGVELMARALRRKPEQRFLWATHSLELIRQSMVRLVELCALFPRGIRFSWAENDEELVEEPQEPVHIRFLTRDTLRRALETAGHRGRRHAWKELLGRGVPITLIYDECHQLGAPELQKQWKKFHESVVVGAPGERRPWRTIGLSATPIPTSDQAREFLERYIFPKKAASAAPVGWNMHVFHKVTTEELQREGILCKVDTYFDDRGTFDVPARILTRIIGQEKVTEPGPRATRDELVKYANRFNAEVMGSPEVVRFLAEKLGEHLQWLGKTIVFLPTIEAANRFVAVLHERFPAWRGKCGLVHSKMGEAVCPGQTEKTPQEVIARFKSFGQSPCILANVKMLTEGFDDPGVRTVVLASLTLSTNRFWQMIGRGTRGPACTGGTVDCNVIDPIKLVRLYRYFDGYQPSLKDPTRRAAEDDAEERSEGALSPAVGTVCRAPGPEAVRYWIDPELERIRGSVAEALRAFVSGPELSEVQALEIACGVTLVPEADCIVAKARAKLFDEGVAQTVLRTQLIRLLESLGAELPALRNLVDDARTVDRFKDCIRVMHAVKTLGLRTHEEFLKAQRSPEFLRLLQEPAAVAPRLARRERRPEPHPLFDERARAIGSLTLMVAAADGPVVDAEIEAALDVLRIACSVPPTAAVRAALRGMVPMDLDQARLHTVDLSHVTRQAVMGALERVADADGARVAAEREQLKSIKGALGLRASTVA